MSCKGFFDKNESYFIFNEGCGSTLYQVVSFKEKQEWDNIIDLFNHKDIYYFHGYCSLYDLIGDGEPSLFFYQDHNGSMICYPFIKRTIDVPFSTNDRSEGKLYDIITPYGYGGPLTQNVNEQVIQDFRKSFDEYCHNNNIISEFIRFHPLLKNHYYLEGLIDVVYDRETVYIDLTKSEEEILSQYHKNHRRNLNKAIRNKLEFRIFEKEHCLQIMDRFYYLYKETMDKLNASPYYYFSRNYFKELLSGLSANSMIAAVFFEGKMISAALCMYEDGYLHYHLGCSDKEFSHLGTNIFQFHHIALWGKYNRIHTFHLGGGYTSRDSLFQFKHRFNQEGTLEFHVGKKIHNLDKYNVLIASWERYYSQKSTDTFFPAYRSKPLSNISV